MSAVKPGSSILSATPPTRAQEEDQEPSKATQAEVTVQSRAVIATAADDPFRPRKVAEHTEPLGTRVRADVAGRLDTFCATRGITKRSALEAAITMLIDTYEGDGR